MGVFTKPKAHRSPDQTDELRRAADTTSWGWQGRLIWALAIRELKGRFTATALGVLWTLIVPLATVVIYSLVFSVIFRAQAPPMGNGNGSVFAVWFFCGLVTWNLFSLILSTGISSIVTLGPMMQKIYIPSYVPVLASSVTSVLERLLEAFVMLLIMAALLNVGWTWLLYPFVLALVAAFATALAYVLAVSYVRFRDTGQITAIALQMWFFVTPVMYPIDIVPETALGLPLRSLIELNPMTGFVEISRDLVYGLTLPTATTAAYVTAWTCVLVVVAVGVYRRWGRDLSEEL